MSDPEEKSAVDRGAAEKPAVAPEGGEGQTGDSSVQEVAIRRSPRYARFAIIGTGIGVVTAFILTTVFPSTLSFTSFQVFGFLVLLIGVVGGALGAVVALIFDRVLSRRRCRAIASRIDANSTQT